MPTLSIRTSALEIAELPSASYTWPTMVATFTSFLLLDAEKSTFADAKFSKLFCASFEDTGKINSCSAGGEIFSLLTAKETVESWSILATASNTLNTLILFFILSSVHALLPIYNNPVRIMLLASWVWDSPVRVPNVMASLSASVPLHTVTVATIWYFLPAVTSCGPSISACRRRCRRGLRCWKCPQAEKRIPHGRYTSVHSPHSKHLFPSFLLIVTKGKMFTGTPIYQQLSCSTDFVIKNRVANMQTAVNACPSAWKRQYKH